MKNSNKFIVTAGVISAGMLVAVASATPVLPSSSFGQLQYGGTPIAETSSTAGSVGNDGYRMNTSTGPGGKQLLIGIKAHEYRSGNNPAGTSALSSLNGGGSWLNVNGTTGAYMGIAGEAVNKPTWWADLPANSATSWGFTWSITLDGLRPAAGAISMSMLITRPDGVATTTIFNNSFTTWDVGTDFGSGNMAYQNNWNVGYLTGGGGQASQVGDWKIKISTFVGATAYGEQEITVTAVPAPGALALLGVAGYASRRRRA